MLQGIGGRIANIVVPGMHQGHIAYPLFVVGIEQTGIVAKGISVLHADVNGMLSFLGNPGQIVCFGGHLQIVRDRGRWFHIWSSVTSSARSMAFLFPSGVVRLPHKNREPDTIHAPFLHPGKVDLAPGLPGIVTYSEIIAHPIQPQGSVGMTVDGIGCLMDAGRFLFKFGFCIRAACKYHWLLPEG